MASMFGRLTREVKEWHPLPLLCKRCNVRNPYPGSELKGTIKEGTVDHTRPNPPAESEGVMAFGSHILSGAIDAPIQCFGKQSKQAVPNTGGGAIRFESSGGLGVREDLVLEQEAAKLKSQAEQKPSMDLFSNIFGDSDSDSEEDDTQKDTDKQGEAGAKSAPAAGALLASRQEQSLVELRQDGSPESKRPKLLAPPNTKPTAEPASRSMPPKPESNSLGSAMMASVFGDDDGDNGIEELPVAPKPPVETAEQKVAGGDEASKIVFRKPKYST